MTQSRKHRGYKTQKIVADHLAARGWPFAESTGAGRSGSDITGTPGLAIEVKARADFSPMAWVRQASANEGLPLVTFRPNGMGEASVNIWPCIILLGDLIDLLHAAGYGEDPRGLRLMCGSEPCKHERDYTIGDTMKSYVAASALAGDAALATIAKVRALPDVWEDASRTRYYDKRHTSLNGIDYEAGFEEGWDHAGDLLRAALEPTDLPKGKP